MRLGITLRTDTPETKAALEGMCVAQREMSDGKMTYGWDVQDPKTVHILKSWDSLEVCDLLRSFGPRIHLLRFTRSTRRSLLNLTWWKF